MSWPRLERGVVDDIDDALRQFESRSLPLANAFLDALESAFDAIQAAPRRYARLETEISNREIRRVILRRFNALIIYRVDGDQPCILAVMHASRQPDHWRTRPTEEGP